MLQLPLDCSNCLLLWNISWSAKRLLFIKLLELQWADTLLYILIPMYKCLALVYSKYNWHIHSYVLIFRIPWYYACMWKLWEHSSVLYLCNYIRTYIPKYVTLIIRSFHTDLNICMYVKLHWCQYLPRT